MLLCALRPMELTSSAWLLFAARLLELVQREHGEERADGEADDQPGRDSSGPAVPPVVLTISRNETPTPSASTPPFDSVRISAQINMA